MKKPPIYTLYLAVVCFALTMLCAFLVVVFLLQDIQNFAVMFIIAAVILFAIGIALFIPAIIRLKNRVLGPYGER